MLKASYISRDLKFKRPSGTSRGVLKTKKVWIITIWNENNPLVKGIGECNPLVGLSIDDVPNYTDKLIDVCEKINAYAPNLAELLIDFPSIYFGFEMALLDLKNGGKQIYFNSPIVKYKQAIKINGLIWMGNHQFMHQQIEEKLALGFSCIKLKIGAIDFKKELELIASIRDKYDEEELELRVDANGAFTKEDALEKLNELSKYDIHSIEQPIKQGQLNDMAELCEKTPFDIALDEELIGHKTIEEKRVLLEKIVPQYIILKPSLIGGFKGCMEWISVAGELGISWWITSALESNVGLNAIAQFTSQFYNPLPQGLGTGQIYSNNFDSNLKIEGEWLSLNV